MDNINEDLINALYKKMRINCHDHNKQVFSKFYEKDYSQKYVILIKTFEDKFILYEAVKDDSKPINVSIVTLEKEMLNRMYTPYTSKNIML